MTPLAAFLSHAALEAGDNQAQQGQDAVQLMTVHAAKGLEFDAVFITGLEERRLMYVAITRARQRLYITLAQSRMLHGQTRYAMRSRFLEEIPEKHLKWLTPKAGLAQAGASQASWGGSRTTRSAASPPTRLRRVNRAASPPASPWATSSIVGQGVHHARFGDGTIIGLSGSGQDAQAEIQFRDVGAKTLALGIAKLDIVQG